MLGITLGCVLALLIAAAWGEEKRVMIVATTDVHGYVYGHVTEPGVYIDYGDFRRFADCMRTKYDDRTFLILDSGDLIQGTGLSDFTTPPGEYIYDVFHMFGYDGITIGNHDAGEPTSMDYEYALKQNDMFISGNVFYNPNGFDDSDNVCSYEKASLYSKPYKIITADDGTVFLILGFLYGATTEDSVCNLKLEGDEDNNVTGFFTSKYWEDAQEEIKATPNKKPDVVITLNHISSTDPQQPYIYNGVRKVYPDAVFVMLNGHSHNRVEGMCSESESLLNDAASDANCVYMEADRYMYSIGIIDLQITNGTISGKPVLDHYDADYGTLESKCHEFLGFDSKVAQDIDDYIYTRVDDMELLKNIGVSNWFYDKDIKQTNPNSLLRLYFDAALPIELYQVIKEKNIQLPKGEWIPWFNAGSLREDLFHGPIIKENIPNILPFHNSFRYMNITLTGAEFRSLYEDINRDRDTNKYVETDDLDYYCTPITPSAIDDEEDYVIISTTYDYLKIDKGMSWVFKDSKVYEWIDLPKDDDILDMMFILDKYLEDYFSLNMNESLSVTLEDTNVGSLENENVAYLTLIIICCIATIIAQIVLSKDKTKI